MRVIASRRYQRAVDRLLSAAERMAAELAIAARPEAWPVIPGTGGARKARIPRAGRGKSGGARVIYFFAAGAETVVLLDAYAKSAKENLTDADRKEVRAAIRAIRNAL
ncbi:type II toxin-antitoxin system RelE/ParE family toxin [Elioraea tepidiphila]|jgi:hypothetical protein|uniref:type II toxin-antitoxin system RelE/ParE family toxin n=1 Tax=Elioraea tepidiphila TaxID=457934 RepID=UPI0003749040|nr:type II toxin-antitoxin system RelE/ParE family toxin [Elioraea tepidiphila]